MFPPSIPRPELHLLRALERHATTQPERAAFVVIKDGHATTLSFAALLTQAERVGATLQAQRRDGVVFVCLQHSPDLYLAFLGAMLAAACPLSCRFPARSRTLPSSSSSTASCSPARLRLAS